MPCVSYSTMTTLRQLTSTCTSFFFYLPIPVSPTVKHMHRQSLLSHVYTLYHNHITHTQCFDTTNHWRQDMMLFKQCEGALSIVIEIGRKEGMSMCVALSHVANDTILVTNSTSTVTYSITSNRLWRIHYSNAAYMISALNNSDAWETERSLSKNEKEEIRPRWAISKDLILYSKQ